MYKATIGLEIHCEFESNSKVFSPNLSNNSSMNLFIIPLDCMLLIVAASNSFSSVILGLLIKLLKYSLYGISSFLFAATCASKICVSVSKNLIPSHSHIFFHK